MKNAIFTKNQMFMGAFIFALVTSINFPAFSQNGVKIAATSGTANSSAMLDVESTTKGALLPRMTAAQRIAIASPADGLIVYQTDGLKGFYSYNNTTGLWTVMGAGGGDNLGNHSATTTLAMNANRITNLRGAEIFTGDGSGWGDNAYAIFREDGTWSHPYPDLRIAYHTGIKLGANSSYNGIRFYNDYNMATQTMSVGDGDNNVRINYNLATVGDIVSNQNFGRGLVGLYDSYRYQNVYAMGAAYRLADNGTTSGNLYGIAWAHTNIGGQTKGGLGHQALFMDNGNTQTAIGQGIWTNGNLTFNPANPYISAPSYFVSPGGAYFNSNTVYFEAATQHRGGIQNDGGNYNGRVFIHDDIHVNGWMRTNGDVGWYNESYGGGWYMQDGTWVRAYNAKPIVFGAGAGSSAASFQGIIQANSVSDGHRVVGGGNSTLGYGYVGTSGNDWWYVYADNHLNSSVRSKKKDITPLDDNMMAYVMNDIDKIKPTFYRYKSESEEMVPGFETKYRPNMHLGVVLDETPDYLQDQAFSGVDIYAMGVFALTGVKYQQKQIKELQQQVNNNMVVGNSSMTSNTILVQLPSGFCKSGEVPVINVTPTSSNSGFYISHSDDKSFTVAANSPFTFNWQAVRIVTNQNEKEATASIDSKLASQLVVDQSKKDKIQEYWRKENERAQAARESAVEGIKTEDPGQYERIMEENRLAKEWEESQGKSGGYDAAAMRKKAEMNSEKRKEAMTNMGKNDGNTKMDTKAPTLAKFPVVAPVKEAAPAPAADPFPAIQKVAPAPANDPLVAPRKDNK